MAWQHAFHPVLAGCVYLAFRFFKTKFSFSNFFYHLIKTFSVLFTGLWGGQIPLDIHGSTPWYHIHSNMYIILKIIAPIVLKLFYCSQNLAVHKRAFSFHCLTITFPPFGELGNFSHFLIITFPPLGGLGGKADDCECHRDWFCNR